MQLKWTIYKKIQMVIIAVMGIIYLVVSIGLVGFIDRNFEKQFNDNTESTSKLVQHNIEVLFGDAEDILINAKRLIGDGEIEEADIGQYLSTINDSVSFIKNIFIVYENGDFIIEPYADIPKTFDPRERQWYKMARNLTQVFWSDPYVDEATGSIVITGSIQIPTEDNVLVVGLDVDLSKLAYVITETNISDNGYVLLVEKNGLILSDSTGHNTNKLINALQNPELLAYGIKNGVIESDKGIFHISELSLTNISVVSFLPKEDIHKKARKLRFILSILILLVLLLGLFIIHMIIGRMIRPLNNLRDKILESIGQDKVQLLDLETNDDINDLIKGYNQLAVHINEQDSRIVEVSSNLLESDRKLSEQYEKANHMAYTDKLTGLPNRLRFEEMVEDQINKNRVFAILFMDVDNFKIINETYGHSYGDFVLKQLAKRLENCCGMTRSMARLSGDEFGFIVVKDTATEFLKKTAKNLLEKICEPIKYKDLLFEVTASIGVSVYPSDGENFEALLANAEIAMYDAKEKSKNTFVIYQNDIKESLMGKVRLENRLITSIERNEMLVFYQPLIDYRSKQIDGFEALVRWMDSENGMIYPDVFIPIAESNCFINDIGVYVLEQAVKKGNELYRQFGRFFLMNVNVSAIQLHQEKFIDHVIKILEKYEYPASGLNLEVTESVALDTDPMIAKKLSMLRKLGIGISLDDFGTGYSSFNHLLNLSLTHLKVDRSIVTKAVKKEEVYKLIQGLVDFAHTVDLLVVAEGVESSFMEQMVGNMGIDLCQGYLYAKPMASENIVKYIETYSK